MGSGVGVLGKGTFTEREGSVWLTKIGCFVKKGKYSFSEANKLEC